ncbi:MAG TPA: alpha/beta fold hydrolase [Actinomycetota bacterium]|nr:alpha/beta fold hydrolase [Actinomycetota bacterium]
MAATRSLTLGSDGLQVQAEVDGPEDSSKVHFLLTHGAGGDRNTAGLKSLAAGLADRGYLVVRPDLPYRALGRSTPPLAEKSVPGFVKIAESARRLLGPESLWVVGGRSYGGRVASMAVAEGLDAAGLLLYSYPLHRPGNSSEPRVGHWPKILIPSLFLEGTHDPFCDLEVFNRHLLELGLKARVHVVEGGDHSLRVAKVNSPDGKARSESSVVASVVPVVEDWVETLVRA